MFYGVQTAFASVLLPFEVLRLDALEQIVIPFVLPHTQTKFQLASVVDTFRRHTEDEFGPTLRKNIVDTTAIQGTIQTRRQKFTRRDTLTERSADKRIRRW